MSRLRSHPTRPRPLRRTADTWRLEPLEPRVLLSADPVFGAAAMLMLPAADADALDHAFNPGPLDHPALDIMPQTADGAIDGAAAVLAANHAAQQAGDLPDGHLVLGQPGSGQAIVFERSDGGSIVSAQDLVLYADGEGGSVRVASPLVVQSLFVSGSGHTFTLVSDISAIGSQTINDSVKVSGERAISSSGGNILLGSPSSNHYLGGNSVATVDTLNLSAPLGNITLNGALGNGQDGSDILDALTITAAQNVSFRDTVVINGDLRITASGIVTFDKSITLNNGGDLIIIGASQVVLKGAITLGTGSDIVIEGNEIDLQMGEEQVSGTGTVTLRTATPSLPMAILSPPGAGTTDVLNLDRSELRAFADGFAGFVFGHVSGGRALAGSGAVSLGAGDTLDGLSFKDSVAVYGGSISVADYSNPGFMLRLGSGDTLRLDAVGNISIANEIEADTLNLVSTSGSIAQQDVTTDNRVGEALRVLSLSAQAATGMSLPQVEAQRLDLVNTGAGDILLGVNAARSTSRFDNSVITGSLDVLRLAQTATSGDNDIALSTRGGSITLLAAGSGGSGITLAGSGTLTLAALGAGSDLLLNAPISTGAGAVNLSAADALSSSAAGSITASGAAAVALSSGTGALSLGAPVTTVGGSLSLASGAALDLSGVTMSAGASGAITLASVGDLTVGIVEASQAITLRSSAGAIIDGLVGDAANLRGDAAALVLAAATGMGSSTAPLRTQVGSVAASNSGSGGIYLAEETGLVVAAGGLLAAGGAGQGAISLVLASGALDVQGAVRSSATGAGSGHVLLQTLGAGGAISLAADLVTEAGSVSVLAAQTLLLAGSAATELRSRGAGQTLDLRAAGSITMAASASVLSQGGAVRLESGGNVSVGRIDTSNAGTVAAAAVGISAGGGIGGAAGAPQRDDIVAGALRLQALGGDIGSAGDALGLRAAQLAAAASGAIFLAEADSLALASVAGPVVLRVAANGMAAPTSADAAIAGLSSSSSAGAHAVVLTLASGDLDVAAGSAVTSASAGHVLVSVAGALTLAAPVSSAGGQISLLAGGAISHTAAADVATSGSGGIDVQAGGAISQADGTRYSTAGGAVRAEAGGVLTVGQVQAAGGSINLLASRIAAAAGSTALHLSGGDLRLQASGSAAGDGIGGGSAPLLIQASRLAAAAAGGGIFLIEADALSVSALASSGGARVLADGSLSSSAPGNAALAGLSSAGALVLQAGAALVVDADAAVSATGALRLGAGTDLSVNASLSSSGGALSLQAGRDLLLASNIGVTGAGLSLDLLAGRDLRMAGASTAGTAGGALRLDAGGEITLTRLNAGAGAVGLLAGGAIVDGHAHGDSLVNIQAAALALQAGAAVGSASNALETDVGLLAGSAASGGLFIVNSGALALASVSVAAQRVAVDGSSAAAPVLALQGLASGSGPLVLVALAGDLQLAAGADVRSGGGAVRLEAAAGSLSLGAAVDSGFGLGAGISGGAVSLLASGALMLADAGDLRSAGGSLDLEAGAALSMAAGSLADSGGGALRAAAQGVFTLGRLDAGSGALSVLAQAVVDAAGDDELADLVAASLRLQTLGTAASDGVGSGLDAIEIAVGRLAAEVRGAGGLFLSQSGELTLGTVAAFSIARVQRDGSVAGLAPADAALDHTSSAGALVLRSSGSLHSVAGGSVTAAGKLLLAATGASADLNLGAALASGGHVSLLAGRDLLLATDLALTASAATLDLQAGRDLLQAQGMVASTVNGAMVLQAGGGITLASLQAGSAAVAVSAGSGALLDSDAAGDAAVNIAAGALRLSAGQGVGTAANALEISVATLSLASAAGGAFVVESDGLRVASVTVDVSRVAADGSSSTLSSGAQEDLRSAGAGDALTLVVLAGDLTVDGGSTTPAEAVQSAGALLLDARAGKLNLNAGVVSAGPVSLLAAADISLAAAGGISVAGAASIDLQTAGNLAMADGAVLRSGSGAVRVMVAGTMTLGAISTEGDVSLTARSITDSGSADLDVSAAGLRVVTTGNGTTQGFGSGALPMQLQVARLAADVAGTGAGGLFVVEADGLAVDSVGPVAVDRVAADGSSSRSASTDAALSDLVSGGNVVLRSSSGAIALRQGLSANDRAVLAGANVLIDAVAGELHVDAALRSTAGHVTLNAGTGLWVNADIATARSARNIELVAGQDIRMAADASVLTQNSDLRLQAGGSVLVSNINAGTGAVAITAMTGSIVEQGDDSAADISGGGLRLNAAGGVGSAENRIETSAITLSARAGGGGIWLLEADAVRVGDVTVSVRRVGPTGGTTELVDARQSDLVTTAGNGSIGLRTLAGNIVLDDGTAPADGRSTRAHGSGSISLQVGGAGALIDVPADQINQQGAVDIDSALRLQGTLQINAGLAEGSGDGAITLRAAVDGRAGSPADRLELHSDGGPVLVLGAVGAVTPLDSLLVDQAGDVSFAQAVHVVGDVVINASGTVQFLGPLLIDSGSLRIIGATRVLLGDVTVSAGDLQLVTDALQLSAPLRGSTAGSLSLASTASGVPVVVAEGTGAGLRLNAATLALLQGFGQVNIGSASSGALAVDLATLVSVHTATLALAGAQIDIAGSASAALAMTQGVTLDSAGAITLAGRLALATAGADLGLRSGTAVTMAADALLLAPGGDISLRAAQDISIGQLDTRNAGAAAGTVLLASSAGTLRDAAQDALVNVQAASVVLRGLGPVLAAGQSTSAEAIDIAAAQVDVDASQGVVLRDTGTDGRTRFNLAVGDVLMQAAVVAGSPSRAAPAPLTGSGALATGPDSVSMAAWLAALRPLAELRGVALDSAALMLDRPAAAGESGSRPGSDLADSAALRYLSTIGAASLQSAGGMAGSALQRFPVWDDSLVL